MGGAQRKVSSWENSPSRVSLVERSRKNVVRCVDEVFASTFPARAALPTRSLPHGRG
jgi:hypothetical protein